jgi:ribosomal protein L11 methylase PrmA
MQTHVDEVLEEEWENAIRASYVPVEVQAGIWVVPEW